MKKVVPASLVAASLVAVAVVSGCQSTMDSTETTSAAKWNHYGEQITYKTPIVSIGALKGDESDVTVNGVITEVCQSQGCWIRLKDPANPDADTLFVRTKDHAFLVPRNAHGRQATVHGRCELSEMSVADQKHYAEEAGKTAEEIAQITQPRRMITFHADSITIEGEGLDKPLDQD